MSKIKLMLGISMPESCPEEYRKPTPEERVREALDLIDSGHESKQEWELIRKLNNMLMSKSKLSDRAKNILNMIQPIMEKYGEYDHRGCAQDMEKKMEVKNA